MVTNGDQVAVIDLLTSSTPQVSSMPSEKALINASKTHSLGEPSVRSALRWRVVGEARGFDSSKDIDLCSIHQDSRCIDLCLICKYFQQVLLETTAGCHVLWYDMTREYQTSLEVLLPIQEALDDFPLAHCHLLEGSPHAASSQTEFVSSWDVHVLHWLCFFAMPHHPLSMFVRIYADFLIPLEPLKNLPVHV